MDEALAAETLAKGAAKKSGVTVKKRLGAEPTRLLVARLRTLIAQGKEEMDILEEMDVSPSELQAIRRELFASERVNLVNRTTEEVFIEYTILQKKNITDLNDIIDSKAMKDKQPNAVVGAIRARSDILDKIIKTGQEFGIIEKVAERRLVVHGHAVAQLDNEGLRKLIVHELGGLSSLMEKYGDGPLDDDLPVIEAKPSAKALPAKPAAAPIAIAGPAFGATGKPTRAVGGVAKAAGGRATARKTKMPPPRLPRRA